MKKLILASLILCGGQAYALDVRENDKQKHIGASFIISTVAYAALRNAGRNRTESALGAVALTLVVGAIKEMSDDHFDREDIKADILGAVVAPVLFWTF